MVCAIELGLIRESETRKLTRKPETIRRELSQWFGKSTTSAGGKRLAATRPNNLFVTKSRLSANDIDVKPPFRYERINETINRQKSSNFLPFIDKPHTLAASSAATWKISNNSNAPKVRNMYYKREKRLAEKTIVFNPFNAMRLQKIRARRNEGCLTKKFLANTEDDSEKENFPKQEGKHSINGKTINQAEKKIILPNRRRYFRRDELNTLNLRTNVSSINICGEKRRIPLGKVEPHPKQILSDYSNQPEEESYESNGAAPKNQAIKAQSNDEKGYSSSEECEIVDRAVSAKRRWIKSPEEEEKKATKVRRRRKFVGKVTRTTEEEKNTGIDCLSEIDETLLVNPSTDLPDTLFASDDNYNETEIALKPQFDVNFDDIYLKGRATNLDISLHREDTNKQGDEQIETSGEENCEINEGEQLREVKERKVRKRGTAAAAAAADRTVNRREDKENLLKNNNVKAREEIGTSTKIARITRSWLKNKRNGENKEESFESRTFNRSSPAPGTIVWGNCQGWWPGLTLNAEDVGMSESEGKVWVYWIGEYRISHLREKTQIQDFSAGLKSRLIETLKCCKTSTDPNYAACLSTVKLINDQIFQSGPLTKPYHAWVEKYLSSSDRNIDRLVLHPYPANVQKRVDQLRQINGKATEKYLSETSESLDRSVEKKRHLVETATVESETRLPIANQKPGLITWAKLMGQVWWPAIIIDFRDCGMKEPNFGCQWILWYGDYTLSQVNHRFFLAFEKGLITMRDYALKSKRDIYKKAVVDAAKDYCSQYGYKTESWWTLTDVYRWFEVKLDYYEESPNFRINVLPGIPGCSGTESSSTYYPPRIVEGLRKHKGNCTIAAVRKHNIEDSKALNRVIRNNNDKSLLKDLCLMCLISRCCDEGKWRDHPFFEGALCEECSEKYTPTIFAYGDDGKCFFCTICAGSDTVVMCDEDDCPRVYCTACLKYLVAPKTYDYIMLNDPFNCFLCQDSPDQDLLRGGLLKPRKDWKDRVSRLFHDNRESVPNQVEYYKDSSSAGGKKKLRVLSLFDGISAGLVVLDKLGIQVDAYYASEIDPDAEMVSSAHFGGQIIRLGDVRSITEEKIREISPINLLIGGSPCNDLSLVNPTRLGLHDPNGTGILVFEYQRIKNLIERVNGQRHFFWMFENVAAMPGKYRIEINEILGREPDLIDAANYSPQHRPRLYWSNFPIVSYPQSTQDLQDVLTPNCNRHALVKKIRTVTTRVNSLKQGKQSLKPILMNQLNDTLWITELEQIFGFPRHYTDVKNLSATKRQKLIGKSWSIQTIAQLMRPLCNFFSISRQQNSL